MPYEKEEDARSEIKGTSFAGEGVQNTTTKIHFKRISITTSAPPHRKAIPSPYKQGESAVRVRVLVKYH